MAIESTATERWRRLFGVSSGIELRVPDDASDWLLVRAWLGARIAPSGPRWVFLPALPREQAERGPPCAGCGEVLTRAVPLRGCTACLQVTHRACRGCSC